MVAKCGDKIVWHWAHLPRPRCDPWWENETDWHRAWKNCFPEEWQEVVHFDGDSGEKHIADVKTPSELVLEFQNSAMNSSELVSRENFYKTMLWIVNAADFDFTIHQRMPDPDSEFGRDCDFLHPYAFTRRSKDSDEVHIRGLEPGIEENINDNYAGHHAFEWNRARDVWFGANTPVYFDLGHDDLWLFVNQFTGYIEKRKTSRWGTVKQFKKAAFVESLGGRYAECSS